MTGAHEVEERLAAVRERVARAAARAGRRPDEVTLVGVSKRQPAALAAAAVRAGLRDLGENYVQEAAAKIPAVHRDLADGDTLQPRWHFVGRLQRNKAREAVRLFDVVQGVDRDALARELDRRADGDGRTLDVLLQVDLCGEPQKGGTDPAALPKLLALCDALPCLRVVGLMTMPEADPDPERSRPAFRALRALRDELRSAPGGRALRELSMGMSADFEIAIEEGATVVRVGTALFGPREE